MPTEHITADQVHTIKDFFVYVLCLDDPAHIQLYAGMLAWALILAVVGGVIYFFMSGGGSYQMYRPQRYYEDEQPVTRQAPAAPPVVVRKPLPTRRQPVGLPQGQPIRSGDQLARGFFSGARKVSK